jgi:hypothetical protein
MRLFSTITYMHQYAYGIKHLQITAAASTQNGIKEQKRRVEL